MLTSGSTLAGFPLPGGNLPLPGGNLPFAFGAPLPAGPFEVASRLLLVPSPLLAPGSALAGLA